MQRPPSPQKMQITKNNILNRRFLYSYLPLKKPRNGFFFGEVSSFFVVGVMLLYSPLICLSSRGLFTLITPLFPRPLCCLSSIYFSKYPNDEPLLIRSFIISFCAINTPLAVSRLVSSSNSYLFTKTLRYSSGCFRK